MVKSQTLILSKIRRWIVNLPNMSTLNTQYLLGYFFILKTYKIHYIIFLYTIQYRANIMCKVRIPFIYFTHTNAYISNIFFIVCPCIGEVFLTLFQNIQTAATKDRLYKKRKTKEIYISDSRRFDSAIILRPTFTH